MTIDQKIVELINADIDGVISVADKGELDAVLATNSEARLYHAELSRLCKDMDSAQAIEPPPHLKHLILALAKPKRRNARAAASWLMSIPALRLSAAFAAGVALTLTFVSSDNLSKSAFDDVTGLVGTISESAGESSGKPSIQVSRADITGKIAAHRSGRIVVIDFDLVSRGPVDIIANFADRNIWFNGFAQLESAGTSVAAEPGRVTLRMDGKRRYALYLHDAGSRDATVDLQFVSSGTIVHEAQLDIGTLKGD
ncbi:MAG: hypothetical protein OEW68_15150 [Gammaproteobacteria bacterium]|nr:hypothetical protein [Gammaproteobacteria bacterium]MDH4316164.1 hypothetical protein [Gammaproteobacteria bacterium]MDH5213315.1 hypothetical protein [Gammaproteobacteria bacterium]